MAQDIEEKPNNPYISFDAAKFELKAKIQLGPIKEVGENGCQVDDVIEFCKDFITGLNKEFSCQQNQDAIDAFGGALAHLEARKKRKGSTWR